MANSTISERIKIAMEYKGFSYGDLSNKTGISRGTISNYINGKYEPKQDKIYLIAKACGVSPAWLTGLDVPMKNNEAQLSETKAALIEIIKGITDEQAAAILQLLKRQ